MSNWITQAAALQQAGTSYTIVTIIATAGSAPQKSGTHMLVTQDGIIGTIGGGRLEEKVIAQARTMLTENDSPALWLHTVTLAASMGQCCGGKLVVTIERVNLTPISVAVFGAGHIGQLLAPILQQLPYQTTYYDHRPAWLEKIPIADNIRAVDEPLLTSVVDDLAAGTYALVMTYSHSLDFNLCVELLARNDIPYIGLIGSDNKNRQFTARLRRRQIDTSRLQCPIGEKGGEQHPAEIATKIAATLINHIKPKNDSQDRRQEAAHLRLLAAVNHH